MSPARRSRSTDVASLLLFPGAGSGSDHPSLLAIEQAVAPRRCVRADFGYRKAGRRAPDRAPVLIGTVVDEAAAMGAGPLVLGGRSMGGRMCSMAVADGLVPNAVGLVLISYPLHPPGRPDKLRIEHLTQLRVPCLFVSGTKDAFGTPGELEHWTSSISGEVAHVWIEGKGHDLKGADRQIVDAVTTWLADR